MNTDPEVVMTYDAQNNPVGLRTIRKVAIPTSPLLRGNRPYVNSTHTDIRKTFEAARRGDIPLIARVIEVADEPHVRAMVDTPERAEVNRAIDSGYRALYVVAALVVILFMFFGGFK